MDCGATGLRGYRTVSLSHPFHDEAVKRMEQPVRDPHAMICTLLSSRNKAPGRVGNFILRFAVRIHNMQVENHLAERPVFSVDRRAGGVDDG